MNSQLLKMQQPSVISLDEVQGGVSSVLYRGKSLSQDEAMGVRPSFYLSPRTLPLFVSGWIALVIVLTTPIVSFATLLAAPLVLTYLDRMQRT